MKVPFVFGPEDLRLCDVETPRAGPRDAVIRVAACGICGSDLGYVAKGGTMGPTDTPMPLGHELSGVVVEVGAEVRSVAPDDRVIVNPLVNLVGNGGPEGGFAHRLLIRDIAGKPGSLLKLPACLTLDQGALVEPLAVAAHAVNRLGAQPGDKVAIYGAGPIGLACIVMLRLRGFSDVVVFELSPFRRDRALKLGAAAAFDPSAAPPAEALKQVHGSVPIFRAQGPATTHFIEASGAPVLPDIVALARIGAAICVVSVQKKPVPLDFMRIMNKELTLTGALGYPDELQAVIDLLAAETVDLEPLISHRYEGDDFLAAFATARQPDRAAKVLVRYNS